ncbi:DUF4158 domain-containing protein [Streptosporangium canum]|uniref:DUF4158 domain-containing protein n=1 Tax=Streptosporangium canum TaxID=324952 RepID=UPI0036B2E943
MRADWEEDELISAWTLVEGDWDLVGEKVGAGRLGFALILKFYEIEGRFPGYPEEIPAAAVQYVASLVEVEPELLAKYSWRSRTIERHRARIRKRFGTRPASEDDEERLAQWLADKVCPIETKRDRLAEAVRERCRSTNIEPPSRGQVERPVEVECPPDDEFQPRRTTGPGRTDGTPPSTVLLSGTYPIDQRQCHPVVNDLPEIIHLPAHLGQHPPLRTAIGQISEEIRHPSIGSDGVLSALLETLLLYILRAWYQDHGTGPGWGPALNDPAISTVLCRIHHNPERQWTVEGLGAEAGLSRAAFARRFTALVGQPPLTYLTWSRMGVAAQMLRNSDAPLGTVAQRVGYTSEFAFSNAFKRTHGAAPGAYRRRNRSLQLR